jgi:hypothetical protein
VFLCKIDEACNSTAALAIPLAVPQVKFSIALHFPRNLQHIQKYALPLLFAFTKVYGCERNQKFRQTC